jgi:hypothetical protein
VPQRVEITDVEILLDAGIVANTRTAQSEHKAGTHANGVGIRGYRGEDDAVNLRIR